jgi:hypothetical protein
MVNLKQNWYCMSCSTRRHKEISCIIVKKLLSLVLQNINNIVDLIVPLTKKGKMLY